jgi:hypothetical protein
MARLLLNEPGVMLKIEIVRGLNCTTIRLIGRLEAECLPELKIQIEAGKNAIVLEMDEVMLVDLEVVQFLVDCQAEGIELRGCSTYIREWIARERDSKA